MERDAIVGWTAVVVILVIGVLVRFRPEAEPIATSIVGAVILFLVVGPYVPGIDVGFSSTSMVGVAVASIGVFRLLVGDPANAITLLFVLGGIGMLLGDQYHRRKGGDVTD